MAVEDQVPAPRAAVHTSGNEAAYNEICGVEKLEMTW